MNQLEVLAAARHPRRWKHKHEWSWVRSVSALGGLGEVVEEYEDCTICRVRRDDADVAIKRGRTSVRAGKDAERAIAKAYGGERVGQYGGQADVVVGELFTVQSKAGGWFSNRYWDELAKLPRNGGRIPTLIVSDRPGPGVKTRRMVIRMMDDDLALHGDKP